MTAAGAAAAAPAQRAVLACLQAVPFLKIEDSEPDPDPAGGPDFTLQVKLPTGRRALVARVRANGQPRAARDAVNQILRDLEGFSGAYGVFVAPYISPQAAEICEREGVGHVDLAGNCLLTFDQVYIRQEGKPNPFARKRDLRSLYSPKAERVLRVLLSHPGRPWKLEALAGEADVSLGQAHNVKKLLADREWIGTGPEGLWLTEPERLLGEWAENYNYQRNRVRDFYSMKSVAEIEAELAEIDAAEGARCVLTGFSGAARVAPFVRRQRITAYVEGDVEAVAGRLGVKEVPSGANLSLIEPYDEGVFYAAREIDGFPVVSPVQLYMDLQATRGRGEEAASAVLEQAIRPSWQALAPTTTAIS
jgi:hypothetical protein